MISFSLMEKDLNPKGPINPHDQLFKELIQTFFKDFIYLFWPDKARDIDFRGTRFLQQEIFSSKAPKKGEKRLDIVAEVKIKGQLRHILIHVEHQSRRQSDFPKRMLNYFCHLWLTHQKPIFPIALFSDDDEWKKPVPDHFEIEISGTKVLQFKYELVKLKNLNWRDYLRTDNPAAVALMAKMGYKKVEMPRVKAEITRILVTGRIRNHPKTAILDNFVQYYLPVEGKTAILYEEELKKLGIKKEDLKMILSKPYQEKLDEGILLGKLQGIEKMLKKKCEWSFITEITEVTKSQYEQLKKKK